MFRVQALKAQQHKLHGDVFLTQPISLAAITAILTLIATCLVLLLSIGSFARTEHVSGYLVPTNGLIEMRADKAGFVRELYVPEGGEVVAGQKLALVSVSSIDEQGINNAEQSLKYIEEQIKNNTLLISHEKKHLQLELSKLASQSSDTHAEIKTLEERIEIQSAITQSAGKTFLDIQELLKKGYISKIESERRYQTWLSNQAAAKSLDQQLASARAKLDTMEIRKRELPHETDEKLTRLASAHADLMQRKVEISDQKSYLVVAPVRGRVVSIGGASVGRSVVARQLLFNILPSDSVLQAELLVPSRAVGFVEKGQEVRLLYDAFPYQRFGTYTGKVSKVAQSILAPDEVRAPFSVSEPVYRVVATLVSDSVDVHSGPIRLQSGMTLKANIVLERRSFIDWMLSPLRVVRNRT